MNHDRPYPGMPVVNATSYRKAMKPQQKVVGLMSKFNWGDHLIQTIMMLTLS